MRGRATLSCLVAAVALATAAPALAQPSNDDFANATQVAGLPFEQEVSLNDAAVEPEEPLSTCAWATVGSTVWYEFTPEADGWLAAEVYSETLFIVVTAYTGSTLGDLAEVACNDGSATQYVSRVSFSADAAETYWFQVGRIDPPPQEDAIVLPGAEPEAEPVLFSLRLVGAIQGTVTNTSGEPLASVCATVYGPIEVEGDPNYWPWLDTVETDSSGQYAVPAFVGGEYKVSFLDCSPAPAYRAQWYDGKATAELADAVPVTLGSGTTGIDATLDLGPDLVAMEMSIEDVPVAPGMQPEAGWERIVNVEVHNAGSVASPSMTVLVWACSEPTGECREVGFLATSGVEAGATEWVEVNWSGLGQAGDFTVIAEVFGFDPDPEPSNNFVEAQHSVLIGGAGIGVDALCSVYSCG